ncbi:MetQ/NlpA family ABC transporter substrate-binding protein [Mailhella massiliensis]|uniref:Lipoprotein n=1 Tax=Mailhella massiliensis TaxID=1903261 RepID=A0A921AXI8_9BACT|nr:MetQ/NlpA family ABC transporter substrate-binding protein [Mailhella massiliensis]HJD97603.1 MetQ/NlpA family ABC transporter substrate-binding protein [Mailhella massiliensis]
MNISALVKSSVLSLALLLAAIPASAEQVVKIGLTGAIYEDIWAPVAEVLAKEGVKLEYVQFSNFSLPNQALANGEVDLNAFQHHAFLRNEIKNNGYEITSIGDTFIIAMNLYSQKIKSVEELKDGDKVAVPNDVTNEGRALKLLEAAGVLKLKEGVGASPELSDIVSTRVKLEFVEIDANLVVSILPDVALAAINGNYALDSGMKADEALFKEPKYEDDSYTCLIASRSADADNPVYKRIVEAYQSQAVIDVFNTTFAGFFVPAWN